MFMSLLGNGEYTMLMIITPFAILNLISIRLGFKTHNQGGYELNGCTWNCNITHISNQPSILPSTPFWIYHRSTHQTMLLNRKGNIHLLGIIYLRRFFSLLFVTVVQLESNFYAFNFRNIFIIIFLLYSFFFVVFGFNANESGIYRVECTSLFFLVFFQQSEKKCERIAINKMLMGNKLAKFKSL